MNPHCAIPLVLAVACSEPAPAPANAPLPDPAASMFARLDRDGSGRVTVDEIPDRHAAEVLAAWDRDQSGDLDPAEVDRAMTGPPPDNRRGKAGKSKGKGRPSP